MAKRRGKAKGKAKGKVRRRRSFRMATIAELVDRLERRKDTADEVVKALQGGGEAISTPGFTGLTPLQEANRVANGLERAIQQLMLTCPNDLSSRFVIDIGRPAKRKASRR